MDALAHEIKSNQVGAYTFLDGYEGPRSVGAKTLYALTGFDLGRKGGGGVGLLPFILADLLRRVSFGLFKFANENDSHPVARFFSGLFGFFTFVLSLPFYALYGAVLAARAIFTALHAVIQFFAEYIPLKIATVLREATISLFKYANDKQHHPILRFLAGFAGVFAAIGAGIMGTVHFFTRSLLSPASATREAYRAGHAFGMRVFGNIHAARFLGVLFGVGRLAISIGLAVLAAFVAVPVLMGAIAQAANAEMALLPMAVDMVEWLSALPMLAKLQAFFGLFAVPMQSFIPVTTASVAASTFYGAAALTVGTVAELIVGKVNNTRAVVQKPDDHHPLPIGARGAAGLDESAARAQALLEHSLREAEEARLTRQRLQKESDGGFDEHAAQVHVAVGEDPAPQPQLQHQEDQLHGADQKIHKSVGVLVCPGSPGLLSPGRFSPTVSVAPPADPQILQGVRVD